MSVESGTTNDAAESASDEDAEGSDSGIRTRISDSLPISRRAALAGVAGAGLLGMTSGGAGGSRVAQWGSDPDPSLCPDGNLEHWSRGRNAREYALYNLCGIELVDSDIVTKFDGTGLSINDDGVLSFSADGIDGRYTDWDSSSETLNFTGAAEWSDEVNSDDFGAATNSASGADSVVAGGRSNTTSADGATVPGGQGNTASGNYSFAAGDGATASGAGTFVWSDTNGTDVSSSIAGEVRFQATGGFAVQNGDVTVEGGNAANADQISDATSSDLALTGSPDVVLDGSDLDTNGNAITDDTGGVTVNATTSTAGAITLNAGTNEVLVPGSGALDLGSGGSSSTLEDSADDLTLSGSPDVVLDGSDLDTNGNAITDDTGGVTVNSTTSTAGAITLNAGTNEVLVPGSGALDLGGSGGSSSSIENDAGGITLDATTGSSTGAITLNASSTGDSIDLNAGAEDVNISGNGDFDLAGSNLNDNSGDITIGSNLDANGNTIDDTTGNLTLSSSSDVEVDSANLDMSGNSIVDSTGNISLSGAGGNIELTNTAGLGIQFQNQDFATNVDTATDAGHIELTDGTDTYYLRVFGSTV